MLASVTNIRYLDNCWNRSDKLLDDYIANKIALGKAIVRGSFDPPKHILSIFSLQTAMILCLMMLRIRFIREICSAGIDELL